MVNDWYNEISFTWKGDNVDSWELYSLMFGVSQNVPYEAFRYGKHCGADWLDLIFTEDGYNVSLSRVTPKMAVNQLRKIVLKIDKYHHWDF